MTVSPELSAWISARIADFPTGAPEWHRSEGSYVARYAALPLYLGWWQTIAIRPDGEIIIWSTDDELSGYSGARPVEDRYDWLSSLVEGSRLYEPLKALLPTRPAGASDCLHLAHPVFAEGKVTCPECCGLGWILPPDT